MEKEIIVYTDGAASGNPGPGGFGVVMIAGNLRKEIAEGYEYTTNNRMELLAIIRALETVKWKKANIKIYTDSRYVADAVNKGWVDKWEQNGFKKKKNPDLWKRFLELYKKHNVIIQWVKGHANISENERCDKLAVQAYKSGKLKKDEGYSGNDPMLL